jgi:murein DD-endopeptidase MepM/ murein hydrolase activator NlpD
VSDRTFKVGSKLMEGSDVKAWQELIDKEFRHLKINCPIKKDGVYGVHTRSYSSTLLIARGILVKEMEQGVTPELRTKIRNRQLTKTETKRFHSAARVKYRKELRERWAPKKVHKPISNILADSWGWHPGVHDGIDLICKPNAALYAVVKSKVIDVRAGGWWGNAPSGDVTKGDGIIQLEVLENVGPFKKGMHIGYGHAEHARVRVGEIVQAGEVIGLAGLAVAWHTHWMINGGDTNRGVGDRDPRKFLDYTKKHGF